MEEKIHKIWYGILPCVLQSKLGYYLQLFSVIGESWKVNLCLSVELFCLCFGSPMWCLHFLLRFESLHCSQSLLTCSSNCQLSHTSRFGIRMFSCHMESYNSCFKNCFFFCLIRMFQFLLSQKILLECKLPP